ncbi:hypothetical protein ACHQM5_013265 [Ranunculus cassubicifolius]
MCPGTMAVLALPSSFLLYANLFTFVVLLMVYFAFRMVVIWIFEERSTAKVPPGTLGLPLIGETLEFLAANNSDKGIYDFVQTRRLRYGDCFKTRIFGKTHVFVSGAQSAKVILSNENGNFGKRYLRSMRELVGGESLLCASAEQHGLLRSQLSHLVTAESMSLFIKQFDQMVVKTLATWEHRGVVIVLQDALKMTFNGMCKMLMSLEDPKELEILQSDVARLCDSMVAFPLNMPSTVFYRGLKARERIIGKLKRIIDLRRQNIWEPHEDFLQSLLVNEKSSSHEPPMLSDTQIQDNILTLIIAGQVTTASAMTWMVKYLDENPEVQDALREQQQKLTSGPSLTLEDLNVMSSASKVVKESLRLASVVAWFPRVALNDCEVEGFKIKRGWIVNVDARAIHLDESRHHRPTMFNSSRFDSEMKPYSFIPFGTGGRTCLGMNLAKSMMIVFLHRLVTTYRWNVTDGDMNLEKGALFSRLKSGCPVRVTRVLALEN